jgi:hypothetical protein
MFIRRVNGRAYVTETVRVNGRVGQRHLGRATPGLAEVVNLLVANRAKVRREERQRRDQESERERQMAEHWSAVRQEFEASMRSAGYHNPNGRGWRRRRGRPPAG